MSFKNKKKLKNIETKCEGFLLKNIEQNAKVFLHKGVKNIEKNVKGFECLRV